tara:strand:+ start:2103 stop:2453 length:351 start_codon:yes stop_codon:yes gene_type:complete
MKGNDMSDTRITWTEEMLPTGADRFPDGLGLALWAGFVEGELMYRIIKDHDPEDDDGFAYTGFTYTVSMMTTTSSYGVTEFMDLALRGGVLERSIGMAKEAAENHEAELVGGKETA